MKDTKRWGREKIKKIEIDPYSCFFLVATVEVEATGGVGGGIVGSYLVRRQAGGGK